jgi:hypothetical protein
MTCRQGLASKSCPTYTYTKLMYNIWIFNTIHVQHVYPGISR